MTRVGSPSLLVNYLSIVASVFARNLNKWEQIVRVTDVCCCYITDLMRCWIAFFILALVVFLVAYIFGLVLCCWRQSKWAYVAGLCAYIAGKLLDIHLLCLSFDNFISVLSWTCETVISVIYLLCECFKCTSIVLLTTIL